MSIDVEDYYHARALAPFFPRAHWPDLERRVGRNTRILLEALHEHGARATFFTLGSVARDDPGLVRLIVEEGHELASHGWSHRSPGELTARAFRNDVRRTRLLLEDLSGHAVRGYRAPNFSIHAAGPWAYEILAEEGHAYSSSRRRPPPAGRVTAVPEVALSTSRHSFLSLPPVGGAWFRLAPHAWTERMLRHAGAPVVFYLHPWEIDPAQPRPAHLPRHTAFRHYGGQRHCLRHFRHLLERWRWDRIDRVVAAARR